MHIFHGDIVTCDQNSAVFSYLVEDGGQIVFVGDELPAYYADSPDIIELGSKAMLPAFGDGHIHFSNWAIINANYDVRSAASIADIGPMIREYSARKPKDKVLLGFGHSKHSVLEKRLITRTELDEAEKKRPVYLVGYDGHSAVVNTAAIGLLPLKMRSLRGFNLESGQLFHEAYYETLDFITGKIPPLKLIANINQAIDDLAGYGVGLVHPVEGIGFPRDLEVDLVRFMAKSAQIEFRIYFQTMDIDKVLKRRLPRIGGCFACALDGCFAAKDAALLEPYTDDETNRGILFYSDDAVTDFVKKANQAGLQVQLHCIGDAAVVQAVKAIEAALEDYPRLDHRHTLIHACMIPEQTIEKIAALGIGITLQPGFLISSLEPAEYLESILGDRARLSSPLRKLIAMGIQVSGGSDGPVTVPNPVEGIYGACNHSDPDQSVSIAEALRMYTYNIAHTSFDENKRGSLEKGKIADMVILNKNPLKMNSADLLELKVEKLYMAGKEYEKGVSLAGRITGGLKNRNRLL